MQYSLNQKLHHWLKVLYSLVIPLLEHALSSRMIQSQMPSSLGGSTSKEKKYLIIGIFIYIQDFLFCLIVIIWLILAPRCNVVDPLYNRKLYQNWKHIIFATVAAWADLCPTYTHISEWVWSLLIVLFGKAVEPRADIDLREEACCWLGRSLWIQSLPLLNGRSLALSVIAPATCGFASTAIMHLLSVCPLSLYLSASLCLYLSLSSVPPTPFHPSCPLEE